MIIQNAIFAQATEILDIFVKCTDVMLENNIQQWDYTYPLLKDVQKDIERKEAYVYIENGKCLGTITLNEQQDKQYKGVNWTFKSKKVLIIHRLAVHPYTQGMGIASQLCTFAEQFAQENNYEVIRLDAYTGNPVSQYLYPKLGYQLADGCCYFHGNDIPFNCFEKLIK